MNRRRASQDTGPPATDPEGEMNMDSNSTVFQPGTPVAMRVSIRIVYLVLTLFLVFGQPQSCSSYRVRPTYNETPPIPGRRFA